MPETQQYREGTYTARCFESEASRDFTAKSLWSQVPTTNHVTELANGILHTTMSKIDKCTCTSAGPR
eukprot:7316179-Ditylum_brightwellii.AAC.1